MERDSLVEQYEVAIRERNDARKREAQADADFDLVTGRMQGAERQLRELKEQLETAREERDLFYDRLQESRKQLETYEKTLQTVKPWGPDHPSYDEMGQ